jgi:hypothetical protein
MALLTSQETAATLQAIEIEAQPKQQDLALLHGQQSAERTARALALHRREDALDQSAVPTS